MSIRSVLLVLIVSSTISTLSLAANLPSSSACVTTGNFPVEPNHIGEQYLRERALNYCNEYRGKTCCDPTTTLAVQRRAYQYYVSENITAACRGFAVSLLCAPCHPMVGVGMWSGVCEHTCDSWFDACGDSLFTLAQHYVAPCDEDSSLVCWPLRDIVSNGREFCERTGFKPGLSNDPVLKIYDDILGPDNADTSSASGEYCFTGSSSGIGSTPFPPRPDVSPGASNSQPWSMLLRKLSQGDLKTIGLVNLVLIGLIFVAWRGLALVQSFSAPRHEEIGNGLNGKLIDSQGSQATKALDRKQLAEKRAKMLTEKYSKFHPRKPQKSKSTQDSGTTTAETMMQCPACEKSFVESSINSHLDQCLEQSAAD